MAILDKIIQPKKEEFVYTEHIDEIKPLTLNLTITSTNGQIKGELRKVFIINKVNKAFWSQFFETSLSDKPISANVQIVFRDKFASGARLAELNLIHKGTKIKTD